MKTDQEEHFVGKIAQKIIVARGNRVLLVQDPRLGKDIWELPGGRMNIDEEPRAAMSREFREEMGVSVFVGEVVHMEQFVQGNENARAFVIVYKGKLENEEFTLSDTEVSKVGWFTKDEIAQITLFPEYKRALEVYFEQL